jgi:hypothetical protein
MDRVRSFLEDEAGNGAGPAAPRRAKRAVSPVV